MYRKIYFVICKHCNHVKSWGDEERITIGGQPYVFSNPLVYCKCGGRLKYIWDHQDGFEQARKQYQKQNTKEKGNASNKESQL
jgi:RNase P subunit RPR2